MSTSVVLPALGESVTEGTVTRWLKNVGDEVVADEPLLEVSTDKVDTEIPSPVSGVLQKILVGEDETVEVGAELALVGDAADATPADSGPVAGGESPEPEAAESSSEPPSAAEYDQSDDTPDDPQAPSTAQDQPLEQPTAKTKPSDSAGTEVTLPELGESVTEGTVTRWLKQVGDAVEVDEPLLEISTDKVDTEIPSPVAGIVKEILVSEDDTVEVGGVLARIGDGSPESTEPEQPANTNSEQQPTAAPEQQTPEPTASEGAPAAPAPDEAPGADNTAPADGAPSDGGASSSATPTDTSPTENPAPTGAEANGEDSSAGASSDERSYATPLVRKLARQHGVDLSQVQGSGVGGRVRKEDVLAAAEAAQRSANAAAKSSADATSAVEVPQRPETKPEPSPLRGTTQPMSRLRKVLAKRAVESMQQTAQLTSVVEVDVTKLAGFRDGHKAAFLDKTGNKLSFLPFFTLAAAEALQAYPIVNATVDGESIVYPPSENISIAVDTERGLLTPVIRDAGTKDLAAIAAEVADLAARTRDNKLKPDELAGGTFTVTNTGSRGALFDTPVVFLPQSAILGTGIVFKRPGVVSTEAGEAIAIRSYVYLALSYDHRIIDGADAARFLGTMKERLEAAQFDADLGI